MVFKLRKKYAISIALILLISTISYFYIISSKSPHLQLNETELIVSIDWIRGNYLASIDIFHEYWLAGLPSLSEDEKSDLEGVYGGGGGVWDLDYLIDLLYRGKLYYKPGEITEDSVAAAALDIFTALDVLKNHDDLRIVSPLSAFSLKIVARGDLSLWDLVDKSGAIAVWEGLRSWDYVDLLISLYGNFSLTDVDNVSFDFLSSHLPDSVSYDYLIVPEPWASFYLLFNWSIVLDFNDVFMDVMGLDFPPVYYVLITREWRILNTSSYWVTLLNYVRNYKGYYLYNLTYYKSLFDSYMFFGMELSDDQWQEITYMVENLTVSKLYLTDLQPNYFISSLSSFLSLFNNSRYDWFLDNMSSYIIYI